MGHWSNLYIGEKNVVSFKYSYGGEWWRILSLIFNKNDFTHGTVTIDSKRKRFVGYRVSVEAAKKRLDSYHLSQKEIDTTLSILLGVKKWHIKYGVLPDAMFDERYGDASTRIYSINSNIEEKMQVIDIGNYLELRELRRYLDETNNKRNVILDVSDVLSMLSPTEIKNDLNEWNQRLEHDVVLDRKYLETARVYFTRCEYDMVYVYLIIALEQELYQFCSRKTKSLKLQHLLNNVNLERFFSDLRFMHRVQFINILSSKEIINQDLQSNLDIVYNMRNNVVHNYSKRYNRLNVNKAIETIEKCIKILRRH